MIYKVSSKNHDTVSIPVLTIFPWISNHNTISGTSLVTTMLAATIEPSPIVTHLHILVLALIQQSFPITIVELTEYF